MVFVPVGQEQPPDPQHRLHIYPFGPYPMLGGVSSTTGSSLTWAHAALGQGKPFEVCLAEALEVAPGAGGVCFVPFLAGERNPYWSDRLRAGFYGLQLAHEARHLLRAVMEGVAYSLRVLLDLFDEMGVAVDEVALAGGGASTLGWPQIIADVCQRPVLIFAGSETVTRVLFALCKEHMGQGGFAESLLRTFDDPVQIAPRHEFQQVYDDGCRAFRAFCEFARKEAGE
jgi:sugar (pentulose or hexulose) kinase